MRMSIIEEQTENVIIESDPDEPDNQPNEHSNGQLYVIFQNNRILFFNFSEGSSETLVGFILVLVIALIILALALGFKFLIFDLFNITGPGIDF